VGGGRRDPRRRGGRYKLPRLLRASQFRDQTMIVAIDGPAGAGKSTVARRLAERLGFRYLDTGAMYRAVTWLAMQRGVDLGEGAKLADLARENPVSFDEQGRVFIAGTDVTSSIRESRIDRLVPVVARHQSVRGVMRIRQRELGEAGDVVIEGRDIGTVVAPAAAVKVYLAADRDVRARRRRSERPGWGPAALGPAFRLRAGRAAPHVGRAAAAARRNRSDPSVADVCARG